MTKNYEEIPCPTAREFFDKLQPTNELWLDDGEWECNWIFRGECKAGWRLLPKAQRNDGSLDRFKENRREEIENKFSSTDEVSLRKRDYVWQGLAEIDAIREFTDFADKLGHPIPEADNLVNNRMMKDLHGDLFTALDMMYHFDDVINTDNTSVALAQHHGIPTRLLDWTENPLVAAYFAAEGIDPTIEFDPSDRIVVWGLSKQVFDKKILQIIKRPRYLISYLHAQEGVFTYDNYAYRHFRETGQWRSLDEIDGINSRVLARLTLPLEEVGELIRLLWIAGISRAHLMPTYDNIAKALETKVQWENL